LFVYLWGVCNNAHCPVSSASRGASALADFNAGVTIQLPDWRGRTPAGLDDMGATAKGLLQALNVTSSGDTVTTPFATGGEAVHTQTVAEMAAHNHGITDPGHSHAWGVASAATAGTGTQTANGTQNSNFTTSVVTTGITINSAGSSMPFNNMSPFMLGTWFMKL
jgi:microcystin-dependent protein